MKKVIAYYRTSTDEQEYGIEAQRATVHAHAAANDLQIVAEYEEHLSGKINERPELAKAMADAAESGARLIVAKVDRLTRDMEFGAHLIKHNDIVFCDHPDADQFTMHIYFAFAQREREFISERTKAGMKVAKANGKQIGRAKGCDNSESLARALEARQSAARSNAANKTAYALVSLMQGATMAARADYLNANGFKTAKGGKWFPTQVRRLFAMYE